MKKTYTIVDPAGLHARPASLLVAEASKYNNDINIIYNNNEYTLKSIMVIMSLGIKQNDTFELNVIGEHDEDIMSSLEHILIENKLV